MSKKNRKKKLIRGNAIAAAHQMRGSAGSGTHKNRVASVKRGSSRKEKHKKQ